MTLTRQLMGGIIILLLLSSCIENKLTGELLERAENLMQNQPDSALILLRDSVDIESLSSRQIPLFALLLTQACDKNYIEHTSDSLINIAVQYYKYTNNDQRKVQSYFYLGSVYRDMDRNKEAIESFLEAKEKLPPGYNTRFKDMINRNLAALYELFELHEKSMELIQENYRACINRKDTVEIMYPLSDIGRFCLYEGKIDSSLIYYKKALRTSEYINDSLMRTSILYGIAQTLYFMDDFSGANVLVNEAIAISKNPKDSIFYYTMKGDILLALGKMDSARRILKKGLDCTDIYVASYCAESLYELEKELGNNRVAITYNDLYKVLSDSINAMNRRADVISLINNHSVKAHTKEIVADWKKERIKWILFIGVLLVFFIMVVIYYYPVLIKQRKIQKISPPSVLNSPVSDLVEQLQEIKIRFQETALYQTLLAISFKVDKNEIKLTLDERNKTRSDVALFYSDILLELRAVYGLTDEDQYCFILLNLGLPNKAIETLMGASSLALRSRKSRMKKKLDSKLLKEIGDSSRIA